MSVSFVVVLIVILNCCFNKFLFLLIKPKHKRYIFYVCFYSKKFDKNDVLVARWLGDKAI